MSDEDKALEFFYKPNKITGQFKAPLPPKNRSGTSATNTDKVNKATTIFVICIIDFFFGRYHQVHQNCRQFMHFLSVKIKTLKLKNINL